MIRKIGYKIILSFTAVSLLALIVILSIYNTNQTHSFKQQNEHLVSRISETVIRGLKSVMMSGRGDLAQSYAENLKNQTEIDRLLFLRPDGTEAFLDNHTINDVNARLGRPVFQDRAYSSQHRVLDPESERFQRLLASSEAQQYYTRNESDQERLVILTPIINERQCQSCHGSQSTLRGVVMLSAPTDIVQTEISESRNLAARLALAILASIILASWFIIQKSVVKPIKTVTKAMYRVSQGYLGEKVPVLGNDEISLMAASFNEMSDKLSDSHQKLEDEHDKLMTVVLASREGMVVANKSGEIVLVNPSAERILQKTEEDIKQAGFLELFTDEEIIRNQLGKSAKKKQYSEVIYQGKSLLLLCETIYDHSGEVTGSSALFRDNTKEKQLNDELKKLSISDALTGLYNRRYLDTTLANEWYRAKRYSLDLSIIMFDVDHFKNFNDTYGHDMGDKVLKHLARLLTSCCRSTDFPCRFGGEEFIAILPSTNENQAMIFAERLRQIVEESECEGKKITVSIGVSSTTITQAGNSTEIIEEADKAMYKAKQNGRNQVRLFS